MTAIKQAFGRGTTNPVIAQATTQRKVRWSLSITYSEFESKLSQYGVESARIGNVYLITSNNIRLQVSPMDFSGIINYDVDAMNGLLDGWRSRKSEDDTLGYGRGTSALRAESASQGYLGSEQHVVWAMGASARTGCFIPAEFFYDNEGFGGTAGNGPEVLPQGDTGEPMSTIAMAHDTDWMVGRLFSMGPLARLNPINPTEQYQIARMGSAGLFTARQVTEAIVRDPRALWDRNDSQENATNRQIRDLLDAAGAEATYFREAGLWLRQNRYNWNVRYTQSHARFGNAPEDTGLARIIRLDPGFIGGAARAAHDRAQEWDAWIARYTWSGSESATSGKNDVREHNDQRAPGFPT